MGFESPLAWLGLPLLALPLVVHLLTRDRAPRVRLPTLRFLTGTPPVAVRWSRVADRALLLVRLGIVLAAATALARPVVSGRVSTASPGGGEPSPTRVILADESRSMLRSAAGGDGTTALEAARAGAEDYAEAEPRTRVVPFGRHLPLSTAIEGATAWLATQGGTGEVVVFSDFQRGTLDDVDPQGDPSWSAVVIEVDPGSAPSWSVPTLAGTLTIAADLDAEGAEGASATVAARWSRSGLEAGADRAAEPLAFEYDPTDAAEVATLTDALVASEALRLEAPFPLTVRFAAAAFGRDGVAPPRAPLGPPGSSPPLATAAPVPGPQAEAVLLRLTTDRMLHRAAASTVATRTLPHSSEGSAQSAPLVVARGATGEAVVAASTAEGGGLALEVASPPASVLSMALLTALGRALDHGPAGSELDPRRAEMAGLRVATPPSSAPSPADGEVERSDRLPRALWLAVLLLLGLEFLYRRRLHDDRS